MNELESAGEDDILLTDVGKMRSLSFEADQHLTSSVAVARYDAVVKAVLAHPTEAEAELALGARAALLDATSERAATDRAWLDHVGASRSSQSHLAHHATAVVTVLVVAAP